MLTPIAITPDTVRALDAALELLAEHAERDQRRNEAAGEAEEAKLARNHVRSYRKARLYAGDAGRWRIAPNGDLLALSSQGGGVVYRVRRLPAAGGGFSPITCDCDHGRKSDAIGLCWHVALYIGVEQLPGALADEADAAADRDELAADDDLAYLEIVVAGPEPCAGDPTEAEIAAEWHPRMRRFAQVA